MSAEGNANAGPPDAGDGASIAAGLPVARGAGAWLENPPWWFRLMLGRSLKRTALRIVALVSLSFLTFHFVLTPIRVVGISMDPNFPDGSVHLINRLAYLAHPPRRGDVIAYRIAGPVLLLKRVIGLPGERLKIDRGIVYINDRPLAERYLKFHPKPWHYRPVALGPDEYFIIGDNRSMSQDRHTFGPRRGSRILGRLIF